jgi:low temperature requirement protein LtrA
MSFKLIEQAYAADTEVDLSTKFTLGIGGDSVKSTYKNPTDLVNVLVNNLMVVGGIILFLMILLAGFKFLQDTTKGKEEAAKILKTALVGFILMFSAFWIVQIIQVMTGTNIILN